MITVNHALTHLFHQSVRDGHTRELCAASMSSLLTVPTQSRDLGEVQVEALDEPVDGISRSVRKHLDEIVTGEFTGRLLGIGKAVISRPKRL